MWLGKLLAPLLAVLCATGAMAQFSPPSTTVTNVDGTITASPTSGAVVVSIPSSVALPGSPSTTTQSAGDSTGKVATTSFVTTAVTNAIAGVNPAVSVVAATNAILPNSPTYNNGVAGIGAFITTATLNTALVIDGYTPALNDRVLVKNEAAGIGAAKNGVYTVTQLAALGLPWILTRALDYDMPSDINSTGAIPVVNGTANTATSWVITSTVNTVGTDALTFTKFSINPTTIQTTTLTNTHVLVGNSSNIATDVAVSGDATMANTGALTVTNVTNAALNSANVFVGNGSNKATGVALTGDVSISSGGGTTVTKVTGTATNPFDVLYYDPSTPRYTAYSPLTSRNYVLHTHIPGTTTLSTTPRGSGATGGIPTSTGTASVTYVSGSEFVNYASGAVSGNAAGITGPVPIHQTQTKPIFTFSFATGANAADITNCRIWCGIFGSSPIASDTPPNNTAAVTYRDATDGTVFFRCVTVDNAGNIQTTTTTTAVANNTQYVVTIDLRDPTQAIFYINGSVSVATNSTRVPLSTANVQQYLTQTTTTTAARNIQFARMYAESN